MSAGLLLEILGFVLIAAGVVALVTISLLFSPSFRRNNPERVGPLFVVLLVALLVLMSARLLFHYGR